MPSLKEIIKTELKQGLARTISLSIVLFAFWCMLLLWLKGTEYLIQQYPLQESRINDFGLAGLGYVAISFVLWMIKISDTKN